MSPFDFVNEINYGKKDLFEDAQSEKDYVPFIVNRALSYFPDTVLYANEMNMHGSLPKQWQFDFLRHSVSKKRRFSKWVKKTADDPVIAQICETYKYSTRRALEVVSLLSDDQLAVVKKLLSKGGENDK